VHQMCEMHGQGRDPPREAQAVERGRQTAPRAPRAARARSTRPARSAPAAPPQTPHSFARAAATRERHAESAQSARTGTRASSGMRRAYRDRSLDWARSGVPTPSRSPWISQRVALSPSSC
jgi:hypothetical protein